MNDQRKSNLVINDRLFDLLEIIDEYSHEGGIIGPVENINKLIMYCCSSKSFSSRRKSEKEDILYNATGAINFIINILDGWRSLQFTSPEISRELNNIIISREARLKELDNLHK